MINFELHPGADIPITFCKEMKTLITAAIFTFATPLVAHSVAPPQAFVGGKIHTPGAYESNSPDEPLAQLLNRAGGLRATKQEIKEYSAGLLIEDLTIRLYRDKKVIEFKVDPNSDMLWTFFVKPQDTVEVVRGSPFKFGIFSMSLKIIPPENPQNKMATPRKPSD